MKILVTAATEMELQFIVKNDSVTHLNTGIGMVSTAYALGKIPLEKYDLALNVGIAGSFSPELKIGDVVTIHSEAFGDFGINSENGFSSCFDAGLLAPDSFPFFDGKLSSKLAREIAENLSIKAVNGITMNTVSGEKNGIEFIRKKFSPDVETMESVAFFYACLCQGIDFVAFRSISNMVEPRNRENWNIPLAVKNLSEKVNTYINSIL